MCTHNNKCRYPGWNWAVTFFIQILTIISEIYLLKTVATFHLLRVVRLDFSWRYTISLGVDALKYETLGYEISRFPPNILRKELSAMKNMIAELSEWFSVQYSLIIEVQFRLEVDFLCLCIIVLIKEKTRKIFHIIFYAL